MSGRYFSLPQPEQSPEVAEPSDDFEVKTVLRQLATLVVAEHRNIEHARQQLAETHMKIAELSSKIDNLIGVATTIKTAADGVVSVSIPEDDPEVAALGKRIDDAIAVLQGVPPSSAPPVAPLGTGDQGLLGDPNALA